MASSPETLSMAVFCDFENVALGVRDANYEKFDIKPILERLLLKGSIVVKKAYCDWDRYKSFKATMHEANFELIEIPHVRQSGKNSADIRLVVDALDLCYTKSHVNTFVIISGDSDFSPLVSKLRENAKQVIGVGVKQSTSDLLVANCDEFIFYDDLVRESRRTAAKREAPAAGAAKRNPEEENRRKEKYEIRKSEAIEMAVETFDALVSERGDSGKIWASMLKEAIKRRKPDFSESYYGFRTFGNLLEEAQARGLLEFGRDEKSGAYVYRSSGLAVLGGQAAPVAQFALEAGDDQAAFLPLAQDGAAEASESGGGKRESRRNGRGGRKSAESGRNEGRNERGNERNNQNRGNVAPAEPLMAAESDGEIEHGNRAEPATQQREPRRGGRGGRKPAELGRDERANQSRGNVALVEPRDDDVFDIETESGNVAEAVVEQREPRRGGRGGRKEKSARANHGEAAVAAVALEAPLDHSFEEALEQPVFVPEAPEALLEPEAEPVELAPPAPARKARGARKPALKKAVADAAVEVAPPAPEPVAEVAVEVEAEEKPAKPKRKPAAAARSRRPRNPESDGA